MCCRISVLPPTWKGMPPSKVTSGTGEPGSFAAAILGAALRWLRKVAVSRKTAPPMPWSAPQWEYSIQRTGRSVTERMASLSTAGAWRLLIPMGSTSTTPSSVGINMATWFW